MRRFLTIGIKGNGKVDVLQGAETDKAGHIEEFRNLAAPAKGKAKKKEKSKYAEVHVVDLSRGVIKRKRFDTIDGSGKRTIARTVKKRKAKPAARKKSKKTASKKPAARNTSAKRAPKKKSRAKAPAPTAKSDAAGSPKADEGMFPPAKPAGE